MKNIFSRQGKSGRSEKPSSESKKGRKFQDLVSNGFDYAEIHRIKERLSELVAKGTTKSIAITAPHDNAGCTLLVSLLGANVVKFNTHKAMVVDLNMRQPQLHQVFNLDQEKGFTDVAKGAQHWKSVVKKTEYQNLMCITAGLQTRDLGDRLNVGLLETMIQEMAHFFDTIIFDTSPILVQNRNNVDPLSLSSFTDASLLVLRDKVTKRKQIEESIDALREHNPTNLGLVYNLQS